MVVIGTWNLENLFRPGGDGPPDQAAYDIARAVDKARGEAPPPSTDQTKP
jgi:hypothetical protein